jgi:hypothetical protein
MWNIRLEYCLLCSEGIRKLRLYSFGMHLTSCIESRNIYLSARIQGSQFTISHAALFRPHKHTQTHNHTHMRAHTQTHKHEYKHNHTHIYARTHTNTSTQTHTIQTHNHTHTYARACTHIRTNTRTHATYTRTKTHKYTHKHTSSLVPTNWLNIVALLVKKLMKLEDPLLCLDEYIRDPYPEPPEFSP